MLFRSVIFFAWPSCRGDNQITASMWIGYLRECVGDRLSPQGASG